MTQPNFSKTPTQKTPRNLIHPLELGTFSASLLASTSPTHLIKEVGNFASHLHNQFQIFLCPPPNTSKFVTPISPHTCLCQSIPTTLQVLWIYNTWATPKSISFHHGSRLHLNHQVTRIPFKELITTLKKENNSKPTILCPMALLDTYTHGSITCPNDQQSTRTHLSHLLQL